EIAHAAAACQRARKRDEDGGCDQTLHAAHSRFPNQLVKASARTTSALGDRRQQRLQRFGARAQARRRFAVLGNQVQPLPVGGGIIGAPGRQRQQLARGMAKGRALCSSCFQALFHVGIGGGFQQELGGANPREILLGRADAAVGGDLVIQLCRRLRISVGDLR